MWKLRLGSPKKQSIKLTTVERMESGEESIDSFSSRKLLTVTTFCKQNIVETSNIICESKRRVL